MKNYALRRMDFLVGLLLVALVLLATACAGTGQNQKAMTAKQQAIIWMSVYNSTYDDTMAVMKSPTSTAAQKDMAQKKKAILTKVWPLLKVYVSVAESGGIPSPQDTASITDLINELTAMATGSN